MPQQLLSTVLDNQEIAPQHFRLRLDAAPIARAAQAGQFVHVLPRLNNSRDPLLRRAFSVMTADDNSVEILFRVMGAGTALLSRLRRGDVADIIGPLGRPFTPLPQRALLVGGGVGVPPLVMLAVQSAQEKGADRTLTAFVGARSAAEVLCVEDFGRCGVPVEISTDDGSAGYHGRVTDLLEVHLQQQAWSTSPLVYACGPLPMLQAVAAIATQYQVPCQVSLEENMPCGLGICNACVVPVMGAGDEYGRYRRICLEGPAVWAHEIDWAHFPHAPGCP